MLMLQYTKKTGYLKARQGSWLRFWPIFKALKGKFAVIYGVSSHWDHEYARSEKPQFVMIRTGRDAVRQGGCV
ncbi:hypothetical protein EDD53_1101 [Pacificibacter maritimus]|uniref:Uncharacterized protein n=1 Tax=Pacificibacter maritimus TaxID=762213 RepID=A0A3N4UMS8_9RHOB|nr:hypothetical protein EDD53_1101 [Pacificibacter maritimus]